MRKANLSAEPFEEQVRRKNFVDNSLFIKDIIENEERVTIFKRSRRFEKASIISMLHNFFDSSKDSRDLFNRLNIMEHSNIIDRYLNKYPVIYLNINCVRGINYDAFVTKMSILIAELYQEHEYITQKDILSKPYKDMFRLFRRIMATEADLELSLTFLCRCLMKYYEKEVIVLLDEYDVPIDHSIKLGYYHETARFMDEFLGSVFNNNECLKFGILTSVNGDSHIENNIKCVDRSDILERY